MTAPTSAPVRTLVTTDPARIDRELVYRFLSQSYWSQGLPRQVFERLLAGALCSDPDVYRR